MAISMVFWRFLWGKMAKLGPIDFTIGLPINIDVNDGHIKYEVDISKNDAKILYFQPKMGQLPL